MASQPTPRLAIPAQWIPLPGGFSTKKKGPRPEMASMKGNIGCLTRFIGILILVFNRDCYMKYFP